MAKQPIAKLEPTAQIDWDTTAPRFVAFLDIMGFKDFVARNTHKQVLSAMNKLSQARKIIDALVDSNNTASKYHDKGLYVTNFSDSIILFSKDETVQSFEMISVCTGYLLAEAVKYEIPMKGAIAHGEITVDKVNQIFFGQPLIDAFLLQEEVHYYGVVGHNSIDKYLYKIHLPSEKIDTSEVDDLFVESPTYLKQGQIKHLNLRWFDNLLDSKDDNTENFDAIKEAFLICLNKIKYSTSGSPRKYVDNTEKMFDILYEVKN